MVLGILRPSALTMVQPKYSDAGRNVGIRDKCRRSVRAKSTSPITPFPSRYRKIATLQPLSTGALGLFLPMDFWFIALK